MPGRPLVVAHRGAWGEAPQNSLPALEAAIAAGCDMVELDVRRTSDGEMVAVHDARVRGSAVGGLTLAELRDRLKPGQAPLLEDMVAAARGRIGLDVELKEPGYVERALGALAGLAPDRYVVTSFADEILTRVAEASPETRTGLLVGTASGARRLEVRMQACGASFVAPAAGLARAGLLAWGSRRKLDCYVWTVNDRRSLRALMDDGRVSAVITDRAASALKLRTELSEAAYEPPR